MAKVYLAPEKFEYDYDLPWKEIGKAEQLYIERLQERARKEHPNDDLVGEIVRWGRGDGYAQYIVWNTKPLELVWLEIGDAWSIEEALIRGLRLSDIKAMVNSERNLAKLFGRVREGA
jgi:hypothetical protein